MSYQTPVLVSSAERYETPLLLDLEELSAAEAPCCDTSGGSCQPAAG